RRRVGSLTRRHRPSLKRSNLDTSVTATYVVRESLRFEQIAIPQAGLAFPVPKQEVTRRIQELIAKAGRRAKGNQRDEVILAEHLIHYRPDPMHILIPNLHKDRPRLRQQIPCDGKPV